MKRQTFRPARLALLGAMLLGSLAAQAQSFESDGLRFDVTDAEAKTCRVSGHVDDNPAGELVIPAKVTYEDEEYTVTSIANGAFSGCAGYTGSITIPESVTAIEDGAFSGCIGFTGTLTLPEGLETMGYNAFYGCTGLTGELKLPAGLKAIGQGCFYNCGALTGELVIPEGLTEIAVGAFENCQGLTGGIVIPESVTSIGAAAFRGCAGFDGTLTIAAGVKSIEHDAFAGCKNLSGELALPEGLITLGYGAFQECSGLTGDLTLPDGIRTIESQTFQGCSGFNGKLTLPQSLTAIGGNAFSGCAGLTGDLKIPDGVKTIESYTFYNCSGFNGKLTLPQSLTAIGESAFSGCKDLTGDLKIPAGVKTIESQTFQGCSSFNGKLTLPESLTAIGESAFYDCRLLSGDLNIPNGVTKIGGYAFSLCDGFYGHLTIPESVTEIGFRAFYGCSHLTGDLNIPEGVTVIEEDAFLSCSGFNGQLCLPASLKEIGKRAFGDCRGLTGLLTIPAGVTKISESAFTGCSSLTGVNLSNVESIESGAFGSVGFSSITLPASVKQLSASIGNFNPVICEGEEPAAMSGKAFSDPNTIIIVPVGTRKAYTSAAGWSDYQVVSDGEFVAEVTLTEPGTFVAAFMEKYETSPALVTNLTVKGTLSEDDIKLIGTNLTRLVSADFSDTDAKVIPASAFAGKKTLMRFACPAGLEQIGADAFKDCTSLDEFAIDFAGLTAFNPSSLPASGAEFDAVLSDKVTELTGGWVSGNSYVKIKSLDMSACTAVTEIPANFLTQDKALAALVLPPNVTIIRNDAFRGSCDGLSALVLPATLEQIGSNAFACQASAVESVDIPAGVREIGPNAFSGWSALKYIRLSAAEPPTVTGAETGAEKDNPFNSADVEMCSLIVPSESIISYISAPYWGAFASMKAGIDIQAPEDVDITIDVEEQPEEGEDNGEGDDTGEDEVADPAEPQNPEPQTPEAQVLTSRAGETTAKGMDVAGGQTAYVQKGAKVTFTIMPVGEGNKIERVTYGGVDVTDRLKDNRLSITSVSSKAVLEVSTTASTEKPDDPENPDNPDNPENPGDPENPDNPDDPENPDNPDDPGSSDISAAGIDDALRVSAESGTIVVDAPEGTMVEVFAITGARVRFTAERRIDGLASGIYLVRVGGKTFKVVL